MIGKRLQPYINDIERRMDKLQTYEFKEEDIIGILNSIQDITDRLEELKDRLHKNLSKYISNN